MPVASTIILDATQLVAKDDTSIVALKSTLLKLQKRASYLSTNDTGDQDIATIKELVAKIKHKMIKRGREANANVDSALQQIAAMASGARSSNMVQGEVMSAAGAGVDVEKPAESEESESEESENAEQQVPFPDVVGFADGDSVEDLLVEIDDHTNGLFPSMPDQIGCLQILVNKLTMDGRLKDAEIARLNDALSAREV